MTAVKRVTHHLMRSNGGHAARQRCNLAKNTSGVKSNKSIGNFNL
jgi:hypothetical protein